MIFKKLVVCGIATITTITICLLNCFIAYAEEAQAVYSQKAPGESNGSFWKKCIIFFIIVIISIIFGKITDSMNKEKGYDTGFAWGFWLWIIGIIVVACRPEKNNGINSTKTNEADEIAKFKELLDSGAITQEEYDAKKKQLLGL